MSAVLELHFRFQFQPDHHNWHVILHQAAKFHPNWTTCCGKTTSYWFSRWWPSAML